MILGIDASNIRDGGGITHLREMLGAAQPALHGVERVVLWSGSNTIRQMPQRPWLDAIHVPILDSLLPQRSAWQYWALAPRAARACNILLVPGSTYLGTFRPFVSISQNMLPFDATERHRYGLSAMTVKLALLARSQSSTFRRSNGVIFLTATARQRIQAQIGPLPGKTTIIPHGIAPAFSRPPVKQQGLGNYSRARPFRWLYVSIVDMYKHQWQVAQAVARLRKEGYPVRLDLVGRAYPPALRRLRDTIAQIDHADEFICYHGPVAHALLPQLYHEADGFVFASSCENMPNILIEAMASGLPIASSSRGPMPEVLGAGGEYFDPDDVGDIISAMQRLLDAADVRERKAQTAYERSQAYSWAKCAHDTFAFVTQLAEGIQS